MKQNRDKVRRIIEEQLSQHDQINMGSNAAIQYLSEAITQELEKQNLVTNEYDWKKKPDELYNELVERPWKQIMDDILRPPTHNE